MLTTAAAEGELGLSHKRWLGQKLGFPDSLRPVLVGRNWPLIQGLTILAWGFLLLTKQYFLVCKLGRRKSLILQVAEKSNQNHGKGVLTPRTSCGVCTYQGSVRQKTHGKGVLTPCMTCGVCMYQGTVQQKALRPTLWASSPEASGWAGDGYTV